MSSSNTPKAGPDDILIRIEAFNRGPEPAELHLLPTLWFRNTWSWGLDERKPRLRQDVSAEVAAVKLDHYYYGSRWLYCEGTPQLLFTENETNKSKLFNAENDSALRQRRHKRLHCARGKNSSESRTGRNQNVGPLHERVVSPGKSLTIEAPAYPYFTLE